MMRALVPIGLLCMLCSCSAPGTEQGGPQTGFAPHEFPVVDDNIAHDTLLIQTTFDLGDGSYVMVAGNVTDTFEGLRLYRYKIVNDSVPEMLAVSSPAYDSWTMLPTFFPIDSLKPAGVMWVLANFGEKESWGQKLMLLDASFHDLGFMDVALPERIMEDDTLRLKRRNIGPFVSCSAKDGTTTWRFTCDSVFVYDDQAGGYDQVLASSRLHFTYNQAEGLSLWLDGVKRPVKAPA